MSQGAMSPIERAEAELKKLQGTSAEEPAAEPAPADQQATVPAGEPAAEPAAAPGEPAVEDQQNQEDPNGESYKQRWETLQGMYRHSQEQVGQLKQQVTDLTQRLGQPPASDPGLSLPQAATQQELAAHLQSLTDEYGEDFTNVLSGVIRAEAAKIVADQMTPLKERIDATAKDSEEVRRANFERDLTKAVPDWREVYGLPEFENYLGSQVEAFSGQSYLALFQQANDAWDLNRIAQFFNAFKQATGRVTPSSDPSPAADPRESLVAPGQSSSSASSQAPEPGPEAKIWSMAEVRQFYRDMQRGKYRGREAEAQQIDAAIVQANAEGRVR